MLKVRLGCFVILIISSTCIYAQESQAFRSWSVNHELLEAKFIGFCNSDGTSTSVLFKDARDGLLLETRQGKMKAVHWNNLTAEDRTYLKENYQSYVSINNISLSARLGDFENVEKMLLQDRKFETLYKDGSNLVFLASEGGNPDVIDILHRKKYKINVKNDLNETPLHWAARCGHLAMVAHLVEKYQLNVNDKTTGYYKTPLYYAVNNGHLPTVKYLVEHGADILSFNGQNVSISTFGLPQNVSDRLFGEAHVSSSPGFLLLCAAAESGNPEVVCFLIENGSSVNDKSGDSILHYVQKNNISWKVKQLLNEKIKLEP